MSRHWDEMSAVRWVEFDRATRTLRVAFESGAVYDFADVPEHLYDDLARSPVRDEFFHQNIRDDFASVRVGDVDLAEVAHELREDAILGSPLAEEGVVMTDESADNSTPDDVPAGRHSHHTWIVDVLDEDSVAVEVDGRQITPLPRWLLPADVRGGDVLRVTHDRSGSRSSIAIEVDHRATQLAYQRSAEQLRRAPEPDKGDIVL